MLAGGGGGGGGGGTADSTAANQVTQIARETEIRDRLPAAGAASQATLAELNAAMGAQADAQATSDSGAFSLLAMFKRSLAKLTTIGDRLPASLGVKTAAASLSVAPASDGEFITRAFKPFSSSTGSAVTLAAGVSSGVQSVAAGTVVRFGNSGSAAVTIEFGTSSVVATANSLIEIMPGTSEAIMAPTGTTHFAAYCGQATVLKWVAGTGA
jgi:hypothetical protein